MTTPALPDRPGTQRVVVTGAAGLVGMNLIPRLQERGFEVVAIDKDAQGAALLHRHRPGVPVIEADLARAGGWQEALQGADALVVAHAQIGGNHRQAFRLNNVVATERLFEAAHAAGVTYAVQISSSVVNSRAVDLYTESKKAQEAIARGSDIPCAVLRPTLMFGPHDRKHLGWLARFMARTPVFPVPGHGRHPRQPLYIGDFCGVVLACLEHRVADQSFSISGLERIDFIDLMRLLREALGLRTPIAPVPYPLFRAGLKAYGAVSRKPPFTAQQLDALVTPDLFEVIDWPGLFRVQPTPLRQALRETFSPLSRAEGGVWA
ncbi:MAG TPA: NAD(P)-dependent oxidoreductase [Mesorhizobium sp.]|nr:NAD(P)-dependent oxidoreductase [Mesorhizobium sp.]